MRRWLHRFRLNLFRICASMVENNVLIDRASRLGPQTNYIFVGVAAELPEDVITNENESYCAFIVERFF